MVYVGHIYTTWFNAFYPFSQGLFAGTNVDCDDDELKNAGEDEDHADEHPDVEEGDVGDSGYILSHLNKAIQSNSRCRAGRYETQGTFCLT